MKRSRKGFTLVELLIVMAIIAALTGVMSASMIKGVAKAKAAAIVANFDSARTAAAEYYALHISDSGLADITLQAALADSLTDWKNEETNKGMKKGNVTYAAPDTSLLASTAKITATFTEDPAAADIATALEVISKAQYGEGNDVLTVSNKVATMDITPK